MPDPRPQSLTLDRQSIRREMRRRRRALNARQQAEAARRLDRLFRRQPLFQRSRHISFYLPNDGEIDPRLLLDTALKLGKRCYLPVLHPAEYGKLWFLPYSKNTRLAPNAFGIPEPVIGRERRRSAAALDLVLLPLVAFDDRGGRLGMGAGYYDRTFAFKGRDPGRNPRLLGLAHGCQQAPQLPMQPWDVPLGAIVTDEGIIPSEPKGMQRDFLSGDLKREPHGTAQD
ncbi:5-formyltetrahydrofolate cyclo-ligase [Proteobacteria bacterium 005FR1]|nr:5-formyltetrahydrofolate cyclo-ligase [Proteobacteria bacterium 005FR1]